MKVTGDILRILDSGDLATLALLDLSAAFDTVDHDVMLCRLRVSYGLTGVSLQWFTSYLLGRTQHIRYAGHSSNESPVKYGVPQGSVLGPILFILYTADLVPLIEQHGLVPHIYADEAQIVGSCDSSNPLSLCRRVEICLADVASWMSSNQLQLNTSKSELMWCSSFGRCHQLPTNSLIIGLDDIRPVATVKNLGLYLDATMSMRTHISHLTSTCFGVLRQIHCIRHSLSSLARTMLITR